MKRNGLDFNASNCLGNATPVTAEILSKLSYGVSPTLISKASQIAVGNLNGLYAAHHLLGVSLIPSCMHP